VVTSRSEGAPDAKGFPASVIARTKAGDWRDPAHVRSWIVTVVSQLRSAEIRQGD
jgi:menaquinone-dependent protoporphyrinogen oxidase